MKTTKPFGADGVSRAGVCRRRNLGADLRRNKPVMGADAPVGGAKRNPASRAMGNEKTIERVASPVEWQSMAYYGCQRDVVNRESCILHHRIRELRVANGEPSNLSEELDLQEGNRRDAPGAMPIQPWEFGQPFRAEDEPDQKMGIEEKSHRFDRRRKTRPRSEPRQSQDHWSALSSSGTWRSRLYCREALVARDLATSSLRSTSRCPLRCTAMTSPSRASSRRRNQFFLASDAVTCFMRTMYKSGWRAVKASGGRPCQIRRRIFSRKARPERRRRGAKARSVAGIKNIFTAEALRAQRKELLIKKPVPNSVASVSLW
jgi:hypothetical protein